MIEQCYHALAQRPEHDGKKGSIPLLTEGGNMYRIWYRKDGMARYVTADSLKDARTAWDYAALKYRMISRRP